MYHQFVQLMQALNNRGSQDGQTLVEYSLILALIAIGAIGVLTVFSLSMDDLYQSVKRAADAMAGA